MVFFLVLSWICELNVTANVQRGRKIICDIFFCMKRYQVGIYLRLNSDVIFKLLLFSWYNNKFPLCDFQ